MARLACIWVGAQHPDMDVLYQWFVGVAGMPQWQTYATQNISYPPMFVLIDQAWAAIVGTRDGYLDIKGPSIFFDFVCAGIAFWASRSVWSFAFVWLNPAVIYDSALWGQNDSIPTAFALASLALARTAWGLPLLAAGALVKPPVAVLAPLLLHWRKSLLWGALGASAVVFTMAWLFFPNSPLPTLWAVIAGGAHLYPWNSVNAFNLWAIWMPFYVPEGGLRFVGDALFLGIALYAWRRFGRYYAAVVIMLAFFCVMTEVHERYLYYAVILCAPLIRRPMFCWIGPVLSLTLLANMEFVWPTIWSVPVWMIHSLSLLNCTILVLLLAQHEENDRTVADLQ
jgi:Gpi18-like mannosyltransferase